MKILTSRNTGSWGTQVENDTLLKWCKEVNAVPNTNAEGHFTFEKDLHRFRNG